MIISSSNWLVLTCVDSCWTRTDPCWTHIDLSWTCVGLVLTGVGLVLAPVEFVMILVDSCWTCVDLCWFLSDLRWFVLTCFGTHALETNNFTWKLEIFSYSLSVVVDIVKNLCEIFSCYFYSHCWFLPTKSTKRRKLTNLWRLTVLQRFFVFPSQSCRIWNYILFSVYFQIIFWHL